MLVNAKICFSPVRTRTLPLLPRDGGPCSPLRRRRRLHLLQRRLQRRRRRDLTPRSIGGWFPPPSAGRRRPTWTTLGSCPWWTLWPCAGSLRARAARETATKRTSCTDHIRGRRTRGKAKKGPKKKRVEAEKRSRSRIKAPLSFSIKNKEKENGIWKEEGIGWSDKDQFRSDQKKERERETTTKMVSKL